MTGMAIPKLTVPPQNVLRLQETVLVVDHDEEVRNSLRELLRGERLSVRLSSSGQEALAMVKQGAPALLIVDASLPDRDGVAVLAQSAVSL